MMVRNKDKDDPALKSREQTLERQMHVYNEVSLEDKSDIGHSNYGSQNGFVNKGYSTMNDSNATVEYRQRYNHSIDF